MIYGSTVVVTRGIDIRELSERETEYLIAAGGIVNALMDKGVLALDRQDLPWRENIAYHWVLDTEKDGTE